MCIVRQPQPSVPLRQYEGLSNVLLRVDREKKGGWTKIEKETLTTYTVTRVSSFESKAFRGLSLQVICRKNLSMV